MGINGTKESRGTIQICERLWTQCLLQNNGDSKKQLVPLSRALFNNQGTGETRGRTKE